MNAPAYAELASASNFSFLRGASHPKDLVMTGILRGHAGLSWASGATMEPSPISISPAASAGRSSSKED